MPSWIEHAVWWQVYPLGFLGAEAEARPGAPVIHRLRRLEPWLDYAAELGASGLALGPVFSASTHGYDTIDHRRIDPRLGDEADLDALIAAAHVRGLRVLLDGVFNHVGRDFPAFREVLRDGPGASRASWFRLSWPRGTGPGTEPDYATFEGHPGLVALDHDEPEVAAYVAGVMDYWLARGADGWRLDAAYAVPNRFWAGILPGLRAAHPEAYFVGEVIHGDYAAIVRETGLDALTQYELWKAIWSALNDRNLFELAHALARHNGFLDAFAPLTFVGNHDVTRIASRLTDPRLLPHALAILFACGGTPSVYAGDEQAFRGIKEERAGGDDAVRPAFPETPAGLAPYGWPVYRLHQELIGLRRRHPWLHRARSAPLHLANEALVLESRGEGRLLVALNLAGAGAELPAPGARLVEAGDGRLVGDRVSLPPYGWGILAA
ncbi:alpha-amylase family glycosyl hydrolase [Methylobacterium nigriterrae]|uniref:alpha-amylase family glycosyl hydrolase n=1 Tax=Methylobacterium nigriterrae TaxID=3127512 RepID=UPI0030133623